MLLSLMLLPEDLSDNVKILRVDLSFVYLLVEDQYMYVSVESLSISCHECVELWILGIVLYSDFLWEDKLFC